MRRRVFEPGWLVVLAVVAVLVLSGMATASAGAVPRQLADDGSTTTTVDSRATSAVASNSTRISRDGSNLHIDLPEREVTAGTKIRVGVRANGSSGNATFSVNETGVPDPDWASLVTRTTYGYRYEVSLRKFGDLPTADVNLARADVSVATGGTPLATAIVDLRVFRFDRDNTIDVNGGTLQIPIRETMGFGDNRTVFLTLHTGNESVRLRGSVSADPTRVVSVPLGALGQHDAALRTDLEGVRLTAAPAPDGAEFNFSYVSVDPKRQVEFGKDRTVRLPVRAFGLPNGHEISVGLGDAGATAVGSLNDRGPGSSVVAIDVGALRNVPPTAYDGIAFELETRAETHVGETTFADVTLVQRASEATRLRATSDGLAVDSPLVFRNDYTVSVRTRDPRGVYSTANLTGTSGSLVVPRRGLGLAETVQVVVQRDGVQLVNVTGAPAASETAATAAITNATFVRIAGLGNASVSSLWIRGAGDENRTVRQLDGQQIATTAGGLDLSTGSLRLEKNGSYTFVLRLENGSTLRARADGEKAGSFASPSGTGGSTLPLSWPVLVALGVLALLVAGVFLDGRWRQLLERQASDETAVATSTGGALDERTAVETGAAATSTSETWDVTVRITDPTTGDGVPLDTTLYAKSVEQRAGQTRKMRSPSAPGPSTGSESDTRRTSMIDGVGTLRLSAGRWQVGVKEPVRAVTTIDVPTSQQTTLTPSPQTLELSTVDAATGEPVDGIRVTVETDAGNSRTLTGWSNPGDVQVSPFARRATVRGQHDQYEDRTRQVALTDGSTVELSLTPRTGDVRAFVTVDGDPLTDATVVRRVADEHQRTGDDPTMTAVTDDSGEAVFDGCRVGAYELTVDVDRTQFDVPVESVTVQSDREREVTLDLSFQYSLSSQQRDQVRALREQVLELTASSGRDVAIPRYYGSVLTRLFDAVEQLPEQGALFASADADPEVLVDTVLRELATATEQVSTAMSSKRNTDLFTACRDLEDHGVVREEGYDSTALFEWLATDRVETRRQLADRLEAVDDRIERESIDLASVAPARELWTEIREQVRADRSDSPLRTAALAFVYVALLDAILHLFEEPHLRKRLERTVF